MRIQFTDDQIRAKAAELGLIGEGEDMPRHLRGRVVAAMVAESPQVKASAPVPVARQIVVQPGGGIDVDGCPFPWVVQADQIEVSLQPDGSGMVRLTIPAHNVQITHPAESDET